MDLKTYRALGDDGEGSARPPRPGSTTNAVDICGGGSDVIRHHVVNACYVQPSGHGIAGHKPGTWVMGMGESNELLHVTLIDVMCCCSIVLFISSI